MNMYDNMSNLMKYKNPNQILNEELISDYIQNKDDNLSEIKIPLYIDQHILDESGDNELNVKMVLDEFFNKSNKSSKSIGIQDNVSKPENVKIYSSSTFTKENDIYYINPINNDDNNYMINIKSENFNNSKGRPLKISQALIYDPNEPEIDIKEPTNGMNEQSAAKRKSSININIKQNKNNLGKLTMHNETDKTIIHTNTNRNIINSEKSINKEVDKSTSANDNATKKNKLMQLLIKVDKKVIEELSKSPSGDLKKKNTTTPNTSVKQSSEDFRNKMNIQVIASQNSQRKKELNKHHYDSKKKFAELIKNSVISRSKSPLVKVLL